MQVKIYADNSGKETPFESLSEEQQKSFLSSFGKMQEKIIQEKIEWNRKV